MTRLILTTALFLATASTAFAGSPPIDSAQTRESMETACAALGGKGERLANGCVNTETGAAITCKNGTCTEYFPDPRYKAIKALIDAAKRKPQRQAL